MELRESVIICTRNRRSDLMHCLDSLALQTLSPQELIIVDSSDSPLQQEEQFKAHFNARKFPATQLRYIHTAPGLTKQRNIGIDHAQGALIYFFDDDVILEKEYLLQMNSAFQKHPDYAGGMGDISNINRNASWKYQLFRRFFLLPREQASGKFTWSGMPTHAYGTPHFKSVEVVGGCCMAFRKDALQQQKFDESFQGYSYMEDADVARRISINTPLFYNPKARLCHNESPVARDRLAVRAQMFTYNYSYLFFKNFFWRNPLKIVLYCWSLIGVCFEAVLCRRWQELRGYAQGLKQFYKGSR